MINVEMHLEVDIWCVHCSKEVDSDGDEKDFDPFETKAEEESAINYYVWYVVNVDVSPAAPQDTLTVSCPCLVSTCLHRLSYIQLSASLSSTPSSAGYTLLKV